MEGKIQIIKKNQNKIIYQNDKTSKKVKFDLEKKVKREKNYRFQFFHLEKKII